MDLKKIITEIHVPQKNRTNPKKWRPFFGLQFLDPEFLE